MTFVPFIFRTPDHYETIRKVELLDTTAEHAFKQVQQAGYQFYTEFSANHKRLMYIQREGGEHLLLRVIKDLSWQENVEGAEQLIWAAQAYVREQNTPDEPGHHVTSRIDGDSREIYFDNGYISEDGGFFPFDTEGRD